METVMAAGPEMDRAVAEACGWTGYVNAIGETFFRLESRDEAEFSDDQPVGEFFPKKYVHFRPSTDWNDAMLAAEKFFGQQSYHDGWAVELEEGVWTAGTKHNDYYDGRRWWDSADADTGPLAICRAILKATQ